MINFKDPKDQTTSALAVLGMVLIGAAVMFWYISIEFFTSFFSYKEGFFWRAFEA